MDEVRTTAASGAEVVLRRWDGARRPVVVVPALGTPARWYDQLAGALAGAGHPVTVVELPGQGDSPRDPADEPGTGYGRIIRDEVATAVADATRHGDQPPVLLGHSMGGQLALLAAATGVVEVAGVALVASGTVHWRAYPWPRSLGILGFTQLAGASTHLTATYRGDLLGFGGVQPRRLLREWAAAARTGRWVVDGEDLTDRLGDVDEPVLSATIPGDPHAPRSAADALVAPVPQHLVTRTDLARDAFPTPVDHLRWLRHPDAAAAVVADWLAALGTTDPTRRRTTR